MPQMLLLPSLHPLLSPSVSYTHGRTYPCVFDGSPCILWCCSVWCWLIAESMNIHLLWCWMRDWIWSVRRQQAIMTYKAWYRGGKSCVCMRQPCCVREAPLIVRDSHWFSLLTFIWLDIWTETQLSNIISKHTLMSQPWVLGACAMYPLVVDPGGPVNCGVRYPQTGSVLAPFVDTQLDWDLWSFWSQATSLRCSWWTLSCPGRGLGECWYNWVLFYMSK